jgi:hypothetical protein
MDIVSGLIGALLGVIVASGIAAWLVSRKLGSYPAEVQALRTNLADSEAKLSQQREQASLSIEDMAQKHRGQVDQLRSQLHSNEDAAIARYRQDVANETQAAYQRGMDDGIKAAGDFSILVSPYVSATRSDNFIGKKFTHVKEGYQYQLFVRGIPVFEAFRAIQKESREEEYDPVVRAKLIESATDITKTAIEIAAASMGGIPIKLGRPIEEMPALGK